jgi:hypothetical protein
MKKLLQRLQEYFSTYRQPVVIQKGVKSEDLQCQLSIRRGKLVLTATGGAPSFVVFPDGTEVNVVPHRDLKRILAEAAEWREWAPYVRGGINDYVSSRAKAMNNPPPE